MAVSQEEATEVASEAVIEVATEVVAEATTEAGVVLEAVEVEAAAASAEA